MVDQAPAAAPETSGKLQEFIDPGTISGRRFPPKGQPLITGFNRIGLWSLYMKEVRRFLKVQTQTVWAPAVSTLLFLVIFTVAMNGTGSRAGREILGVPFATFVAPCLIMMGMMNNA